MRLMPPSRLIIALLIATLILACGGIFWMIGGIFDRVHNTFVDLVMALLFSYVVYPPIRWLAERRIPTVLGGLSVYAVLFLLISGAIAWLAPAVANQATELSALSPKLVAQAQQQLADPVHAPLLGHFPLTLRMAIAANAGKAATFVGEYVGAIGFHTLTILKGTTSALANLGITMGLTLLMITELDEIHAFALRLIPSKYRPWATSFVRDADEIIGAFVRGQVIMALSVAAAGTLVLTLVGLPYAILLGLLAGILCIVPIIGPIVAFIPVVFIAFFTVGLTKTLIVAALFSIIIAIQQNILVPILVARSVGISPLAIFVALLLGSEAFGILGALLSIPIAGILRVCAERSFPPITATPKEETAP